MYLKKSTKTIEKINKNKTFTAALHDQQARCSLLDSGTGLPELLQIPGMMPVIVAAPDGKCNVELKERQNSMAFLMALGQDEWLFSLWQCAAARTEDGQANPAGHEKAKHRYRSKAAGGLALGRGKLRAFRCFLRICVKGIR